MIRPSLLYRPGRFTDLNGNRIDPLDNWQLQFHKAPHVIRLAAPGNGAGKTAMVGVEVDWWMQGDHPFQTDVPTHRERMCVWLCQKYQQWEMLRAKVEKWWTPGWSFRQAPHYCYTWEGKGKLFIITSETDWSTVQGIEPDLVALDETPPHALWVEMQKRRRGATKTRYIASATQTEGLTWMYSELYLPWKKYHEARGVTDEAQMMRRQLHRWDDPALADVPGIWVCPYGSHRDNPTATAQTWAEQLQHTAGSEIERQVRLYGGFRDFANSPVFSLENLERMKAGIEAGRTGAIVEIPEAA